LLPIFLIVVVDVLGFTIILPLLPFYSERLGASPTLVGEIVAIFAVFQLISGPILGQQMVPVLEGDTPATLHARIQEAERALYPAAIAALARGEVTVQGRQTVGTKKGS